MKKRALLIWIPLVALLCNGIGYLIVSNFRAKNLASGGSQAGSSAHVNDARHDDVAKEDSARARRAAGLAALEAGEYEKALINFTEARALVGDRARVDDLLRVTEDLRSRARLSPSPQPSATVAVSAPAPTPPARWVSAFRPPARPQTPTRQPASEPTAGEPRAMPSGTGLLLVTTTPRGLLVQVDGAPVDLTPMRTSLKPGAHRVALLDGDRRLYETSVEVSDGNATTVLKDLSSEMTGEPARSALVGPASKDEPNRPAGTSVPAGEALAIAPPAARPPPRSETGGLEITSPGLYGVVWVNDRPQGFPPVSIHDLPAGPVKVEVRVNGVEKRVATVVVQPGLTTPVKIR
jgi:hypothetical protein